MRALLSMTDKDALVPFAAELADMNWQLVATSGTAAALEEHGIPVTSTAVAYGTPQMLDGRVKTLHHALFAALLARGDRITHLADLNARGIAPIDLYSGNFYRFGGPSRPHEDALDSIDIGGPAMMRAAAKNHPWVIPLIDARDFDEVVTLLRSARGEPSGVDLATRRRLAVKVFHTLSGIDAQIARTLSV